MVVSLVLTELDCVAARRLSRSRDGAPKIARGSFFVTPSPSPSPLPHTSPPGPRRSFRHVGRFSVFTSSLSPRRFVFVRKTERARVDCLASYRGCTCTRDGREKRALTRGFCPRERPREAKPSDSISSQVGHIGLRVLHRSPGRASEHTRMRTGEPAPARMSREYHFARTQRKAKSTSRLAPLSSLLAPLRPSIEKIEEKFYE